MVTITIKNLQIINDDEMEKLTEEYSESYRKSAEILTGKKVANDIPVFEEYTYSEVKDGVGEILNDIKKTHHRLPVVNFAAGGIATPADAALMMQLGSDGVFVGSGIFKSNNPTERAKAIVEAVANFNKPDVIAEVSKNLGEAMAGIEIETIPKGQLLQERGW
ncbi:MAG: hypothetical protein KAR08_11910 [Candidatus Heimdallarchaeota archaeon]|nr:hypothetical protein [Candidatus Heimdallarchaeota archaeon]